MPAAAAKPHDSAEAGPAITVAVLPNGTGLGTIGDVEGLAPGLMSAGIGRVPAIQTFLDISQGNRVSQSLYESQLRFLRFDASGVMPADWQAVVDRAAGAPADIVPGLLGQTLEQAGIAARAEERSYQARLIAADGAGEVLQPGDGGGGLLVRNVDPARLATLVSRLGSDDLLIAIEGPPPAFRTLTIAIAGEGFDGLLTSDSTRTDGLVTSTDLAPTILEHLGVEVPDEMNGQPISSSGDRDVSGLIELRERLEITGERRGPVVGQTLLIWVAITLLAVAIGRGRAAAAAVPLLCLSVLYLPLVLLFTPALDPSLLAERLAAGVVAPVLALTSLLLLPGWWPLAFPCLLTVVAYGADVVAGSALVPLSIPGPNPASGSRFFGIGNEIEATIAALLPLGVGAALAGRDSTRDGGPEAAAIFLGTGIIAAAPFALGRFGADVGAAIVLPAGAAVAAAVALGTRRGLLLVVLVPIACLVALMAADLIFGGGAHLTRSVLDAGGLGEAGDVFERRIRLAASSFTRGSNLPFLALALVAIAIGVRYRHRIRSWFGERAALAGFAGALAAAVVGTVSNDSGATLLILGATFAWAAAGFAWSLHAHGR